MSAADAQPALSVVVALISGAKADLDRCLAALAPQAEDVELELLVPYDPPVAEVAELASKYPAARFLPAAHLDTAAARAGASREHHDSLRTIGLRAARGRVVALTEDHAVATDSWCADMLRLLDEHPRVAAHNALSGQAKPVRHPVAVDQQVVRGDPQPGNGPLHGKVGGAQDVQLRDLVDAGMGDGNVRTFREQRSEALAPIRTEFLRVVEAIGDHTGVEPHRRGRHRPRKGTAADFVDADNPDRLLALTASQNAELQLLNQGLEARVAERAAEVGHALQDRRGL